MGAINIDFFKSLSVEKLIIKIWDFSSHVHHKALICKEHCNHRKYLNFCIDAAREQWTDDFIFFDTTIYKFQFHAKELAEVLDATDNNEIFLECFVRLFSRDK